MESKNRKMKPDSILHILFVFITTNPTVRVAPRARKFAGPKISKKTIILDSWPNASLVCTKT